MNDAFGRPRSVVVLGGTSDIAQAIVDRLVQGHGRTVVLAARHTERLDEAADRARDAGADQVTTVNFDAVGPDPAADTVAQCFAAAGEPVDLVVVAVGALGAESGDHHDPSRIAELATINFTWPAAALGAAAERLQRQGSGRIVVLSSVAALRTRPNNLVYGAAKAGLDSLALGLARSLRGSGVTVHVVRPGFVTTKMTTGRAGAPFATDPATVAEVVVRGVERGDPVIWAPALLRWVFAAVRLLPDGLWWQIAGRSS